MAIDIQPGGRNGSGTSPLETCPPAPWRPQTAIAVAIASDHALFREAVRRLLDDDARFRFVGEAATTDEARTLAATQRPDVLLIDLAAQPAWDLEILNDIVRTAPGTRALLLASEASAPRMVDALQRGARGVVLKTAPTEQLFKSISAVMAGEYWISRELVAALIARIREGRAIDVPAAVRASARLTPREEEMVAAVASGCSNREIAEQLSISTKTVKHHLTNIFEKLGLSNRLELALSAVQYRRGSESPERG
jgi:DNA-binding NarL/FixJ family response regulator